MVLSCPACHSQFQIDPTHLGDQGRTVRCGVCRYKWFQHPDDLKLAEPDLPLPDLGALRPRHRDIPVEAPSGRAFYQTWYFFLGVVIVIGGIIVGARVPILRTWPATVSFYNLIGLPRLPLDLALHREDFEIFMDMDQGHAIPKLKGKILNVSGEKRRIPYIVLNFYNKEECQDTACFLGSMTMPVHKALAPKDLKSKETYTFVEKLPRPIPKDTQMITAAFDLTDAY